MTTYAEREAEIRATSWKLLRLIQELAEDMQGRKLRDNREIRHLALLAEGLQEHAGMLRSALTAYEELESTLTSLRKITEPMRP